MSNGFIDVPQTLLERIKEKVTAGKPVEQLPTKASARRLTVLKPLFCLAAVVLPIVTLTTVALADDDKTYVGAECRSIDPANDPILLQPNNGTMSNVGQRDQTWICPVVRDSVDKDPSFARITVIENGTNQVTCTFEARDTKGATPLSASPGKREQFVLQTNPLLLVVLYSYGSGDDLVLSGVPFHGYYYFRCNVPGRNDQGAFSGVVTYIVTEQD